MPSDVRPLRELCSLIADCPHSTPVWTESGYVVVRNQNIKSGRLDLSAPSFTDAEHFSHRTRRAKPTVGDIIFTREAPMGEVCMIPAGVECCVGQRQVLLRPNPDEINGRYLLYALQSPGVQHEIGWSEGTGSTVSNVRIPVLEALRIPTPPIEAQRAIGQILGALDGRIDLLRETNATLESIAAAAFKSWFVDFDPVRAKAEGREPEGMSAEIAALFPSKFVDSELGPIPKGWNIQTLGSIADVVKGKSYSSKDLVSGGSVALVTLKSFERGGGFRMDGFKPYAGLYKPSQVVRAGDVVVAYTDVTQAAELIGRPAIVVEVDQYETLVASLDVGIIRPVAAGVSKEYLFGLLQSETFLAHALAHTTGTTVLHLAKEAVPSFRAAISSAPLIAAYSSMAAAIRSKVQSNIDMGRSLRSLRDLVLPALISGRTSPVPAGVEANAHRLGRI